MTNENMLLFYNNKQFAVLFNFVQSFLSSFQGI